MIQLFLLSFLIVYSPLVEACNISNLILSSSSLDLSSQNSPEFEVRVVAGNVGAGCDFFITIDNGVQGGAVSSSQRVLLNGSANLPIQFYSDVTRTQVIKDFPEAGVVGDVLFGHYNADDGPIKTLYIRPMILSSGLYSRFGLFTNSFNIKTFIGTPASYIFDRQKSLQVSYVQPKRIDLSLVESGESFNPSDNSQDVNFGNLVEGDSRSFDVIVNYNAGYELRLNSTHAGFMRHSSLAAKVPYVLYADGQMVSLVGSDVSSVVASVGSWAAPAGGRRIPMRVQVGALNQAPPGQYQDQILMSVQTTE